MLSKEFKVRRGKPMFDFLDYVLFNLGNEGRPFRRRHGNFVDGAGGSNKMDGSPKCSSANREMGTARICSADAGVGEVGRQTARKGQGQAAKQEMIHEGRRTTQNS